MRKSAGDNLMASTIRPMVNAYRVNTEMPAPPAVTLTNMDITRTLVTNATSRKCQYLGTRSAIAMTTKAR